MRTQEELARLALACLDLTSLNDDDGEAEVVQLAARARGPAGTPAALCVWPALAAAACRQAPAGVAVTAVANFPDGGSDIEAALRDTGRIVDAGAQEVDLVLPWRALMAGDHRAAAKLVAAVRRACQGLRLKLILETGELAAPALITAAARLGLDEGVDFLKTSTGKTAVGATPEAARLLLQAIADTPGSSAGFKASGGVRTVAEAAVYIDLVAEVLGKQALTPARFRIGASGLLNDIETILGSGAKPAPDTAY